MLEGNAGRTCGGSRDTELANDPDMRSETDFLDALLARGIREINRPEGEDMPTKAYQCGSCYEVHEFYHEAESCCQPAIDEGWSCDVCADFHSEKEDAANCCIGLVKAKADDAVQCPACLRDQSLMQLIAEIEISGHCSECNPHFSIDDTFKIGDLVDQQVAENLERMW